MNAGTPKKSARQDAALLDADAYDPRNFMVKGGTRAYEQKLTNLSRACIQKVALERLSEEGHARSCQEAAHNSRLREITKRLRDEHNARTAAETEVAQLKQQVVCLEEPARAAQDLRGSVARLEATLAGEQALIQDLRSRLALAESKLDTEAAAKERDAQAMLKAAAGKLQADLTELQAVSTLSSAHAAAGKTELERLRRECSELSQRDMANQEELDRLRESLLNARGEAAGYKASTLQQKEAILAETVANHASQLEMWRSEATEVATAASKWKQRALNLQQQLETLEKESSSATQDVRLLASRAGAAEADRARLADLCASLEVKLSAANQELTTLHTHLQDALSSQAAAVRKAEACTLEAAQSKEALGQLQSRLQEEGGRTLALRQDLAALSQQQVGSPCCIV
ncbi:uncharacterized protein HaLaN_25808 [Haematococcus lacustris]|uniref:Uncharacterized protein n=1 Tax=Haematococcus lacustris TaxID=44745 RepID=A0A699ZYB3_HAELA|nr:uncharacterized protein HaLaN_25808 [Haematococcus lacustris]